MSKLENLTVQRVSFVKHPANQRKFLLMKSKDADNLNNPNNPNEEGTTIMKDEVRKKVQEILKADKSKTADVVAKECQKEFTLSDLETVDVQKTVEMIREFQPVETTTTTPTLTTTPTPTPTPTLTPTPTPTPVEKTTDSILKASLESLEKQNKELAARLESIQAEREMDDVAKWLEENAPYVPEQAEVAKHLYKLRKSDADNAKFFEKQLIQQSELFEKSNLLNEIGTSREGTIGTGVVGDFMAGVNKTADEVRKSGDKISEADAIAAGVHKMGPGEYERYRKEVTVR